MLALLALPLADSLRPPADTTPRLAFGAFVDSYYAWDAGRPPTRERSFAGGAPFLTQAVRHDEFNVNLAFVEARLTGARVRGRVAVQAGTAVQANYAAEPRTGTVSGPELARLLQEAVAGVRVGRDVWVDAGIFFAHVGMESWIPRDNLAYTRALVSDYSPYYASGVKVSWAAHPRLAVRLDVTNGWQTISEARGGKGAGVRLDWTPVPRATVSYYDLYSDEAGSRLRTLHGIGATYAAGPWSLLAQADVGTQRRAPGTRGHARWHGLLGVARYAVTRRVALVARAERFRDPEQVVLATSVPDTGGIAPNPPFRGGGGSLGVDVSPAPRVQWRTELRALRTREALFPDGAGGAPRTRSVVAVTALALTF